MRLRLKDDHPLRTYFEEYGHEKKFDDHVDAKIRNDGFYVLLLFKSGDMYYIVDIASDGMNNKWVMQNDCSDLITMEQWKKTKIVPYCDWYTIGGNS